MENAEELYEELKLYVTNHSKWLDFLKEVDRDPRGVYNTAGLDDRLFLLNDQIKAAHGQCKATKDQIEALEKSMPTETQIEMEMERLKSLTLQRDEIQADLKGVFTKIQQRDVLGEMKSSLDSQLEVVQKEYETEIFPDLQDPQQSDTVYKDLCSRLDALKKACD